MKHVFYLNWRDALITPTLDDEEHIKETVYFMQQKLHCSN